MGANDILSSVSKDDNCKVRAADCCQIILQTRKKKDTVLSIKRTASLHKTGLGLDLDITLQLCDEWC